MEVDVTSEMFKAISHGFVTVPWSQSPDLTIDDVSGGPQVHEWLSKVFLSQLFAEDPSDEYENGFCTEKYPCLLGEGNAHEDSECALYLQKGKDNCPSYLGGKSSCCEPCSNNITCPNITYQLKGSWATVSSAVTDLSAACGTGMPPWISLLESWPVTASLTNLFETPAPTSSDPNFCPERLNRAPQSGPLPVAARTLTLAGFNQVLAGRITMKRIKLVSSSSPKFKTAYPQFMSARGISAFSRTDDDNHDSFGTSELYTYSEDGGYLGAGGFVHFLDFSKSQTVIRRELDILKNNYWFDLNQATLAIEMLFFNGNYEMFMHITFVFEHDFSGETNYYVLAQPLNMSFINSGTGFSFWLRYLALLVMVVGFFGFFKYEMDDISADPLAYFTNALQIIHFISLVLSLVIVIVWCSLVYSYDYRSARLPLDVEITAKTEQFENIVGLAGVAKIFSDIMSVNLCLIIIRCILLMANMTPFLSVIINTISTARLDLFSFVVVFAILFFGFTVAGYILCGSRTKDFSTWPRSFITCLKMVMGESNFEKLDSGDQMLGQPYFFCFHLIFIIIKNVLLSVICLAYYKERKKVDEPNADDKYPLKRFIRQVKSNVREWSRFIGQCIGTIWQFLFGSGSGSAIRVNYEQVNLYRDKRGSFKPKTRSVQYESKQDEFQGDVRMPNQDIRLRPKKPFYRDGLMNYYVDYLAHDGLTAEAGVKENFRLVAIQQQGESDPVRFRDREIFESEKGKTFQGTKFRGFGEDARNILEFEQEHPPIQLEFEGWVQPISWDCVFTLIFVIIYSLFLVWSMRIQDSFNLTEVQRMTLFEPHWFAYNPTRLQNFSSLEGLEEVSNWFHSAIENGAYSCVTSASNPEECTAALNDRYFRSDHALFAGPDGMMDYGPDGGVGFTPGGADGQSLGYVPWSDVQGGDPSWESSMSTTPRMFHWNVGFMPNNFVRTTMQVACFDENEEEKWKFGYPFVLNKVVKHQSNGCAQAGCMDQMVRNVEESGGQCLDSNGRVRNPRVYNGAWSSVNYTFSKTGTYKELGGIAIGLGATKAEADIITDILHQDQMLRGRFINSIVLEYVVYNEHYDMFTYNMVSFSILATGKMKTKFHSVVFPLNVFSTGQQEKSSGLRSAIYVSWVTVLVCVLGFTFFFLRDLFIQYRITSELQKPKWSFLGSFFAESWWNVLDLFTVILLLVTQYFFFRYVMIDQRINDWGWSSWTTKHMKFNLTVAEDRKDDFFNFSEAAYFFDSYTFFASWSILFIAVRTIKYMVSIQQLHLVVLTMSTAVWELLAMLLITFLALFGFASTFFIRYGTRFYRFGDISNAFCELFIFMCGVFDTEALFHQSPEFFFIVFPFVQLVFYFILANMFLAVTVYKWREVRKTAQEDVMSTFKRCWKSSFMCSKRLAQKDEEDATNKQISLDEKFWQQCAVLTFLSKFDDSGNIRGLDSKHRDGGPDGAGKENEEEGALQMDKNADGKERNLDKMFKKAHMEIASQMCRNVALRDDGAGVQQILSPDIHTEYHHEDDSADVTIGIVEDQVDIATSKKIKQDLEDKLKLDERKGDNSVAQEIWLDALITVLEDVEILKAVQAFFLPPPMIKPRTQQEWGVFDQKKVKMSKDSTNSLGFS
jgi:hypothetical protein